MLLIIIISYIISIFVPLNDPSRFLDILIFKSITRKTDLTTNQYNIVFIISSEANDNKVIVYIQTMPIAKLSIF